MGEFTAGDGIPLGDEPLDEKNSFDEAERTARKLMSRYDIVRIYENGKRLVWNNGNVICETDR